MTPPEARPLSDAAQRVQDALRARGLANAVRELDVPVRTAQAAADQLGCDVAQIVKSLVFRRTQAGAPGAGVLVLASGARRVDEAKLATALGGEVAMGDPRFVREVTGFAIGGIPPLAHAQPLETLIDRSLLEHAELWAAAGHPNSMFPLTPAELVAMTGGRVTELV